jgi:hypothetical protein
MTDKSKRKPVRLLSLSELCKKKLGGLSLPKFKGSVEPVFIARGMKYLQLGKQRKYLESSVDEVILMMIENDERV